MFYFLLNFSSVRIANAFPRKRKYPFNDGPQIANLADRMREMLNTAAYADVHFLFENGEEKEVLPAHKAILSMSTNFFEALIRFEENKQNPISEKSSPVCLVNISSDIEIGMFKKILSFVYAYDLSWLNADNLFTVLSAAHMYDITELVNECVAFPLSKVSNIFDALAKARSLELEEFALRCLLYIDRNALTLIKSEEFLHIDQKLLAEILQRDNLDIKEEIEIWKAALRWADIQCADNGIERSAENRRAALGPALFQIRFTTIPKEKFAKIIDPSGILTAKETLGIYKYHCLPGGIQVPFATQKRDYSKGTLVMDIGNFKNLKGDRVDYSDVVYIGGLPWKIKVQASKKANKFIDVILICDAPTKGPKWICDCSASFRLLSKQSGVVYDTRNFVQTFNNDTTELLLYNVHNWKLHENAPVWYNKEEDKMTVSIDVTVKQINGFAELFHTVGTSDDRQQTELLAQRMKELLQDGTNADVHFLVKEGDKEELLPAHKAILSIASHEFEESFHKEKAINKSSEDKNSPVVITDVPIDAFKTMLDYIYSDDLSGINSDNLFSVFKAAKKYKIDGLAVACADFPISKLPNVFSALVQARALNMEKMAVACWHYIDRNALELIKTEEFLHIDQTVLINILQHDKLDVYDELLIWEAALRWADAQCRANGIECSAENRRAALGPALFQIRFTTIPKEKFAKIIDPSGILTAKETLSIYKYHCVPGGIPVPFATQKRENFKGTLMMEIGNMKTFKNDRIDYSEVVYIGGIPWKIRVQANGDYNCLLDLTLLCEAPKNGPKWSCACLVALHFLSQQSEAACYNKTYKKFVFNNKMTEVNYPQFVSILNLCTNNNKWYNEDEDKITVAFDVTVDEQNCFAKEAGKSFCVIM